MYFWIISSLLPLAIYWILTWNNSNINLIGSGLNFFGNSMSLQQIMMLTFLLGIWAGYSICKMIQNAKNIKLVSKKDIEYMTRSKQVSKPEKPVVENENI